MRTLMLPGLGGDANMYPARYYQHLTWVTFADWPAYRGEKTIKDMAARLIQEHRIGRDFIVGGASLGGMVALQIAKDLGLEKAILIGSATDPRFVNPVLKKLSGIVDITPIHFMQMLAGRVNGDGRDELLTMFEKADTDFIRTMCRAVFLWEGAGGYDGLICQIHGECDRIIFPPPQSAGTTILPEARHVISMTHAETVAAFIRKHSWQARQAEVRTDSNPASRAAAHVHDGKA